MSVLVFPHLVMIFIGKTVVGQTLNTIFNLEKNPNFAAT